MKKVFDPWDEMEIRMILENYFVGNLVWKEDLNESDRVQSN